MSTTSIGDGFNNITLMLDNGDLHYLEEAMKKWSFKSHKCLIRFAMGLLLLNENKYFTIKVEGTNHDIVPADNYLKRGE